MARAHRVQVQCAVRHLDAVVRDRALAAALRANGLETIAARHTCAHRVDELMTIADQVGVREAAPA